MRAFLVKFFARHYLQAEYSLVDYVTSNEFLEKLRSGRIRVLDIGCGPAVIDLALVEMIRRVLDGMKELGLFPVPDQISVDIVLNDKEDISICTAKHMLRDYFRRSRKSRESVLVDVAECFPQNMRRLYQISQRLGGFDIVSLSYIVNVLFELDGMRNMVAGIQEVGALVKPGGRILILQDKFQDSLMSRLARSLGVELHIGESRQQIFPPERDRKAHTYSYRYCLFQPDARSRMNHFAA